jgi:hypothetical protein
MSLGESDGLLIHMDDALGVSEASEGAKETF